MKEERRRKMKGRREGKNLEDERGGDRGEKKEENGRG